MCLLLMNLSGFARSINLAAPGQEEQDMGFDVKSSRPVSMQISGCSHEMESGSFFCKQRPYEHTSCCKQRQYW